MRLRGKIGPGIVLMLVAAAAASPAAAPVPQAAAGTLDLRALFPLISSPVVCPADVLPADVPTEAAECRARTSTEPVRGLGTVSLAYTWALGMGPPTCERGLAKALPARGRLTVAGKGDIAFSLAAAGRCVTLEALPQNEPQEFTITGGTGVYSGASGRGTVGQRSIGGGVGSETWTGKLDVPGLTFDVTPPTMSGARPLTVRVRRSVKRARVTFAVTATDDVDGSVPVSCVPRSGSRFPVGRTRVRCEAVDTSANRTTAVFTVTVVRRR